MLTTMQVLVEDVMYFYQGKIPMSTEGMLRISGSRWVRYYLKVWSTSRFIDVTSEKLLWKYINPKERRYIHLG